MNDSSSRATSRTRLGRHAERGHHDRETIDAILDEALYCHVGIVREGRPLVLPTLHVRLGDRLYIHGAAQSRFLQHGAEAPACVTVTLLDGLVLARSAFHHSLNYRSVVVFGDARVVDDPTEKRRAMDAMVEHVVSGRGADCRPPSEGELAATTVLSISLEEASAKIRGGPPIDAAADQALPHWAGVLPLELTAGEPVPDPDLASGTTLPAYLREYRRGGST